MILIDLRIMPVFFFLIPFFFWQVAKMAKTTGYFLSELNHISHPIKKLCFFCSTSFTNKISIWQLSDVKRTYQKKVFESPRTAPCSQNRWHMIPKKEYKPICIGTVRNVFFIFFVFPTLFFLVTRFSASTKKPSF